MSGSRNKSKGPEAGSPKQSGQGEMVGRNEVKKIMWAVWSVQGCVLPSEGDGEPWRFLAEEGH